MDVTERNRGDRLRLARLIAKELDVMQRDRLRSVLLALQGRETLEIAGTIGRSRAFVPGRKRRLRPDWLFAAIKRQQAGR